MILQKFDGSNWWVADSIEEMKAFTSYCSLFLNYKLINIYVASTGKNEVQWWTNETVSVKRSEEFSLTECWISKEKYWYLVKEFNSLGLYD